MLKDLLDVSADQSGRRPGKPAVEGDLGLARRLPRREPAGDGAAEGQAGVADLLLQSGRQLQAAGSPVGRLIADLVDLAAGQLDEQVDTGAARSIRVAEVAMSWPVPSIGPGRQQIAALIHGRG